MVDFNQPATVGTPPTAILQILIIQKRDSFLDAYEAYKKIEYKGQTTAETYAATSRLLNLFLEIQPALFRTTGNKPLDEPRTVGSATCKTQYELIQALSFSNDINNTIAAFYLINEWLDDKKIIRIDNRENYDRTNIELSNKKKGFS